LPKRGKRNGALPRRGKRKELCQGGEREGLCQGGEIREMEEIHLSLF